MSIYSSCIGEQTRHNTVVLERYIDLLHLSPVREKGKETCFKCSPLRPLTPPKI